MFIALFALRRIISNICCSNQFPLTYHTAVYRDRNLGLIIAIGLASITGFVKKKVCREKSFRLGRKGHDGSCGRAGIYYSYASFDSYHRLLA